MEVLNLQFAFLVTGRDLNPALIAYECVNRTLHVDYVPRERRPREICKVAVKQYCGMTVIL